MYPFTLILKDREKGALQEVEVKIDPGSKTAGVALVGNFQKGRVVIWAANLASRGNAITSSLITRRSVRRSRRNRKTRYRAPRFDNRERAEGWLAPSLQSRVDNVATWVTRLQKLAPIFSIVIETVRFDTQKIQNPEISGILYQQGDLMGYEIREYLLEKWGRKCVYCDAKNTRLEIDHITPKSRGGSNRVSNLTIACRDCNVKKGNVDIQDFLQGKPKLLSIIIGVAKTPLKDAAAVTTTRSAISRLLSSYNLPITYWSGGRTKFNRTQQNYEKDHWIDAACIGITGSAVQISKSFRFLTIKATGRGTRQFCRPDKYGFPRTSAKKQKSCNGFTTGDLVKAIVPKGKKEGTYFGRVGVRFSGNFCIDTSTGKVDGISHRYCKSVQRLDGYNYVIQKPNKGSGVSSSPSIR